MKFKIGDKVKVLTEKCSNPYDRDYLHHNVKGRIFEIINVNNNCIHLLGCKYAFIDHLIEKVEDMEEFKFGQVCYCGEERHKRYLVTSHDHFYYVTDYELVGDGQPFLVERFHRGKVYNSPMKEYSMQEIADALKIDVKDLRIKK